jgi:hypothetical protein
MHTTNVINTFISVAEDCPVAEAEPPQAKAGKPTVAALQYEMLQAKPYHYTSDDVIFSAHPERSQSSQPEKDRAAFFSKGQACMRASPLTKRYGYGVHANAAGKIAIFARESAEYANFAANSKLTQVKAMRQSRA